MRAWRESVTGDRRQSAWKTAGYGTVFGWRRERPHLHLAIESPPC
jgi:hypothetical protein